jgi:hypothetical protein
MKRFYPKMDLLVRLQPIYAVLVFTRAWVHQIDLALRRDVEPRKYLGMHKTTQSYTVSVFVEISFAL